MKDVAMPIETGNITIQVNAAVTGPVDRKWLEQRIADQLRKLANPVRQDSGLTVVQSVRVVS